MEIALDGYLKIIALFVIIIRAIVFWAVIDVFPLIYVAMVVIGLMAFIMAILRNLNHHIFIHMTII